MPPIDRLLSQYSDPIRSWPGEEDLDAEARANYAAANPTPRLQRPEEVWRGAVLPLAEMRDKGSANPSDWQSSGDVLKHLDQGSRWAVPGVIQDVMDAAQAIYDTSGWGLGPATRFSTLPAAERERVAELGVAGATAGVTGGLTRAAVAPRLPAGVTELGIFGGRKARTADLDALARAEEMTRLGHPREDVWSETGWFRGPDDQWKFEIDDSRVPPPLPEWSKAKGWSPSRRPEETAWEGLTDPDSVLKHYDLSRAYPDLEGTEISLSPGSLGGGFRPGYIEMAAPTTAEARSALLHELQHAVQRKEGFASGTSPKSALDEALARSISPEEAYHRYAGEAEARAVQARRDLTPEQRRERPPWLDYDVPERDLIVSRSTPDEEMIFAGPKARTADAEKLASAQEMDAAGVPRDTIWSETGWFKGVDGKWRFEIDDSNAKWRPEIYDAKLDAGSAIHNYKSGFGRAPMEGDLFAHEDLYAAYPGAARIGVHPTRDFSGAGAYRDTGNIELNTLLTSDDKLRSTNLHELQHAVQQVEDFARGSNPNFGHARRDVESAARAAYEANRARKPDADDELLAELGVKPRDTTQPWEDLTDRQKMEWWEAGRGRLYRQSAGETESRAVQARRDLTPEGRRARPPWLDYDVPESDQIVRFGSGG